MLRLSPNTKTKSILKTKGLLKENYKTKKNNIVQNQLIEKEYNKKSIEHRSKLLILRI